MYASYVVPHYSHIPYLSYIDTSFSRLPSYMLPPNSSKNMSERKMKRRKRRSNEMKNTLRASISITNKEIRDIVSVSVYGSHKEQGK